MSTFATHFDSGQKSKNLQKYDRKSDCRGRGEIDDPKTKIMVRKTLNKSSHFIKKKKKY